MIRHSVVYFVDSERSLSNKTISMKQLDIYHEVDIKYYKPI